MMELKLLTSPAELMSLRDVWEEFTARHFPHLCNSFHWQVSAWQCYFPKSPLRVILLYDGGKPAGILPLCASRSSFARFPVTKYHFFEQGIGLTHLTILSDRLEAALRLIWEKRAGLLPRLQVLKLAVTAEQKKLLQNFFMDLHRSGLPVLLIEKPVLSLTLKAGEGFREKILTAARRRDLTRYEQRLHRDFDCSIDTPSGGVLLTEFEQYWQRLIALYGKSWKNTSERSLSANAAEMRFFHGIFQEYARRHALWANFLRLNEQDAAAVWCVKHQGVIYGLQTVYDQRYKSYAPGSYLLQKGLISLEAAGDLRFDFMGNQPYKKYLSNGRCCYYDVYILPGNCYGRLLSRLGRLSSSRLQPFTSEF